MRFDYLLNIEELHYIFQFYNAARIGLLIGPKIVIPPPPLYDNI
jgi:hypothetical protein